MKTSGHILYSYVWHQWFIITHIGDNILKKKTCFAENWDQMKNSSVYCFFWRKRKIYLIETPDNKISIIRENLTILNKFVLRKSSYQRI